MASVSGRVANHYELLGLTPDASQDDVERAYRLAISPFIPQVLGGVASASIAYSVLRDPERRRAYDLAEGFVKPPEPVVVAERRPLPAYASANCLRATPHMVSARAEVADVAPVHAEPAPRPFLATPEPPRPVPVATPVARHDPVPVPRPAQVVPRKSAPALPEGEAEDLPVSGRQAGIVAGVIGAVGLVGGLLGWTAGQDVENATQSEVVTTLPKAVAATPLAEAAVNEPSPAATVRPPKAETRRPAVARQMAAAEAPAQESIATEALAAEPEAEQSPMPLPRGTVASTLRRIGYSCGSVTSTESAGGGVYNITCSSGQRFRAMPINGRYRFKRQ